MSEPMEVWLFSEKMLIDSLNSVTAHDARIILAHLKGPTGAALRHPCMTGPQGEPAVAQRTAAVLGT